MKVLMAMSGGVDSSLSAKLLLQNSHEVIGCYVKLHERDNYHEENIRKVKKVADFLGIEVKILDLRQEFEKKVYEIFINSYKNGITPNPCAHCNRFIKFGALWEYAKSLKCDKIATGHYAIIENNLLKVAKDLSKDQSYFLSNIEPQMLKNIIFPLGDKLKSEVKQIVAQIPQIAELATQKESSEICFVPNTYIEILNRHFQTNQKGIVRNIKGEIVGSHEGYMNFTIGKRKGFTYNGAHEPHYVTSIDPKNNEITVGLKEELEINEFETINFNNFTQKTSFEAFVKIRYRSYGLPCIVSSFENGLKVKLLKPAYGLAKGQLAVFYDENNFVLGSGFIK